ncbi:MAG: hypothetical protein WDN08_21915 [Rhizomicrobium sp.]
MGALLRRTMLVLAIIVFAALVAVDLGNLIKFLFPGTSGNSGTAPLTASVPPQSLRIATFNTYLLSWLFRCHSMTLPDCLAQTSGLTDAWANHLADTILANSDKLDVIALNEVWDEDAKAILIKRLSKVYPVYVAKIDASLLPVRLEQLENLFHLQIAGEDSGLMLFAKADYKVLPLPNATFKWGNSLGEFLDATTKEVAFTLFDSCGGSDCGAGKGAALIRLQNRMGGPIFDIVFTHTQADYPDDPHIGVRGAQFGQIRKLIETTLAPFGSRIAEGETVLVLGDQNVPLLNPKPPSEFTALFDRPGSFFTNPMNETWLRTNSREDRYMTNSLDFERYDYILESVPGAGMSPFKAPCVQHLTVPVVFQNLESDHYLLHADINADGPLCNPMRAFVVSPKPGEAVVPPTPMSLATPGAMQWFLVRTGGVGTYDVTLDVANPANMRMDIYQPTDLTTPVAHYNTNPIVKTKPNAVARIGTSTTEIYSMPGDFFIRISGVMRTDAGPYKLTVLRRNCASKAEACILQPGYKPQIAQLSQANPPPNMSPQNEAWFRFDVAGTADDGTAQSVTLTADRADAPRVAARLDSYADPLGASLGASDAGAVTTFAGKAGDKAQGFLVIAQSQGAAAPTAVSASFDTNLRLFEMANLTCIDETNPEIGSDDIYTEFDVDGQIKRAPKSGDVEFDCDDATDPHAWPPQFGGPTISFSDHLKIRVEEGDATSNDDRSAWFPPVSLAPGQPELMGQNLQWSFDGGKYQLDYNLRRRANGTVAAVPPVP